MVDRGLNDTRISMTAFCLTVWTALTAAVCESAGALQNPGGAQNMVSVRARVVDSAGLADDIRTALGKEVEAIWSAAGVRVDTYVSTLDGASRQDTPLYVVLRDQLPLPTMGAGRIHDGRG